MQIMKSEKITIRKPVFITMAVLYIAIIVLGLAAPEWFSAGEAAIVEFTCRKFGALYDLLTLGLGGLLCVGHVLQQSWQH